MCHDRNPREPIIQPNRLLVVLALAFALGSALWAQTMPPPGRLLPTDATIVLELRRPQALLGALADDKAIAAIQALPAYGQWSSSPKSKEFLNLVKFLETTLDTDWRTAIRKLTSGGITMAVDPQGTVLVIVDAEDEHLLDRLHGVFLAFARSEAEKQSQPGRVASKEYGQVTAWSFNGTEAHAILGKRFVLCSHSDGLKAVLDRLAKTEGPSLEAEPAYQSAMQRVRSDAVARVFVNLRPLKGSPKVARLLEQERENPLAALVFAAVFEAVRQSSWLAAELQVEDRTFMLKVSVDGKPGGPSGPAVFALPQGQDEGVLPCVKVPHGIASLSLYRDLRRFYRAKDDLFPQRTSGLIFFENMMGIFFSGRDLTDDVMAQIEPEIRLVVAEQEYDPQIGTPQVQLPAFAAVLRLRHPDEFKIVLEEAWQKALGLVNFTRGQQALSGLIIDRPVHNGVTFTMAYFPAAGIKDRTKLDQRFNFRPCLAMPGEYAIMSSTEGLARDLIDALNVRPEDRPKPKPRVHSVLEISAQPLASVLERNRGSLINGNMVQKGSTQQDAAASIDMLIALVRLADGANLSFETDKDRMEAQLELKLKIP